MCFKPFMDRRMDSSILKLYLSIFISISIAKNMNNKTIGNEVLWFASETLFSGSLCSLSEQNVNYWNGSNFSIRHRITALFNP